MERVFCVNRTEVNKSYSRSRARKSPKSRTSERSVSTRRSLVSLVRSLARSRFTLACIASHVYASRELIGSSRFVDFVSFSLFLPFLLVDITRLSRSKKKRVKQRTNLSFDQSRHMSFLCSEYTDRCDSLERKRHFAGCQKKYIIHPGEDAISG